MTDQATARKNQEIRQMALQIKTKQVEERYRLLRLLAVILLLAGTFIVWYLGYAEKRTLSKRENILGEVNHQLLLANAGNIEAESTVKEWLPELETYAASRLPTQIDYADVPIRSARLFVRAGDYTKSVGRLNSRLELVNTLHQDPLSDNWVRVTIVQGPAMWMQAEGEETPAGSESIQVKADTPLYQLPDAAPERMLGIAKAGQGVTVMEQQGDWIMVRPPTDFVYLVRKDEYLRLLKSGE